MLRNAEQQSILLEAARERAEIVAKYDKVSIGFCYINIVILFVSNTHFNLEQSISCIK